MGQKKSVDFSVSVAANATNRNALADLLLERMPFDGFVSLYATGSAAGLEHSLSAGYDMIMDQGPVNANNRQPIEPDDAVINDGQAERDAQLTLKVVNTTGGALTYRFRLIAEAADRVVYQ